MILEELYSELEGLLTGTKEFPADLSPEALDRKKEELKYLKIKKEELETTLEYLELLQQKEHLDASKALLDRIKQERNLK